MQNQAPPKDPSPRYLNTKEVAELLRVKERKVYDLAAGGEIPHRRITGKLLFPRDEITAWIEGDAKTGSESAAAADRPAVLVGSHDPLLDWAARESGAGLATLFDGSMDGLARFAAGDAALSGLHLPERDGGNAPVVAAHGVTGCVLIGWATRTQGLILGPEVTNAAGLSDLRGRRLAVRQAGAGGRALLERLLSDASLNLSAFAAPPTVARTETDAAAAVAAGEADAAIGLAAAAGPFRLGFKPLVEERFDLLIDRRAYFTEPVQALLAFSRSGSFREKAAALGGYDVAEAGAVRWLSP